MSAAYSSSSAAIAGFKMNPSNRLLLITVIFVTCLIAANIIAVKVISFGFLILPASIFVFPLSYIIGDILTEVYGYRWARRVIWLGFGCNLIGRFPGQRR